MVHGLNWRRKLTDSDDAAIAALYRSGIDGTALARRYGVAKNTIYVSLAKQQVGRHRGRIGLTRGMKRCSTCRVEKVLSAFGPASGSGLTSKRPYCRDCNRARNRVLGYSLRRNTGIRLEYYERIFQSQSGRCAICAVTPPVGRRFHVDHDHRSMEIRGLLCARCNALMGRLDRGQPIKTSDAAVWRPKGERYQRVAKTGMLFVRARKPESRAASVADVQIEETETCRT